MNYKHIEDDILIVYAGGENKKWIVLKIQLSMMKKAKR